MSFRTTIAAVVVIAGCTKAKPSAQETATKPTTGAAAQAAQTFDGLSVGGTFDRSRTPYEHPCDSDALESEPNIKAMFYTGKECRDHQFPDGTSVIILVDDKTSKISALAWVGGTYFDSRNAPLKTGAPIADAVKAWGQPAAKFDLRSMHVTRFANDTRVLSNRNDQVIGFAFGEWPDANGDRWDPLDQVNERYTAQIPSGAVSAEKCRAALTHVYELMASKGPVSQDDLDDCRANNTPAQLDCMSAAKDKDAVSKCYAP